MILKEKLLNDPEWNVLVGLLRDLRTEVGGMEEDNDVVGEIGDTMRRGGAGRRDSMISYEKLDDSQRHLQWAAHNTPMELQMNPRRENWSHQIDCISEESRATSALALYK